MAFPGGKEHRESRTKLGRGQHVAPPPVTFVMSSAADTATLTFNVPVVLTGTIPLTVSGGVTRVSQTLVSPNVVEQLFSGPLTGLAWSLAAPVLEVRSYQGGALAGASGTF
jgi:hypothetical protein